MTWNAALPADSSLIALSAGYLRSNNIATQSVLSISSMTNSYSYIPTDGVTAIYFYTAAAPNGWTLASSVSDCLLGIQGGTSQFLAAGGTVVGTWTTAPYQLTSFDIPGNPLSSYISYSTGTRNAYLVTNFTPPPNSSHTHTWTTTRPTSAVGILCTKNL